MIPRSGNLILRLHQRAASPHVRHSLLCGAIPPPYRHRKRSRGIFVATPFLIPALIRLHEAPYPPMHGKDRLPVSVHTHTSFDRQRKRFLVGARNDTWGGDRLTSSFIPPAILTSRNYFLKSNVRLSRPLVSSSRAQPRDLCCCRFLDSFANPFA